jgi:hypothetical protein
MDNESTGSLAQIQQLWAKLDVSERKQHLRWTMGRCPGCGGENIPKVPTGEIAVVEVTKWPSYYFWCDACLDEEARILNEEAEERERKERENGDSLD